jgi:hypothetical protein
MKRMWLTVGVVTAVLVGAVAVAQARPWAAGSGPNGQAPGFGLQNGYGPGMMAGGQGMMAGGRGMMAGGRGMMAGGPGMLGGGYGTAGGAGCVGAGVGAQNWDPAAMQIQADAMVAQHKAVLAGLETQLAAANDESVKAVLTARIELQNLMLGSTANHAATLKSVPQDDWLGGAIQLAQADVTYWSQATAADANNTALIASHLANAQQRLTYLQDLQKQQATETN